MIAGTWPPKHLRDVMSHRSSFVTIDDRTQYKRCRVQLNAKGVVLRDFVLGVDLKTKEQQVCRAGDFLVAEIDAKLGGFGIVSESLDGAIVSSHYFLFETDESQLRRTFLNYFIRTPEFQDQVRARGSTNYAAIRPHHVLDYTIRLPGPEEQDQIVAKLDAAASRMSDAQRLCREIDEEADLLIVGLAHRADLTDERKLSAGWTRVRFGGIAREVFDRVEVSPDREYPNLGIYSFGRGLFHKPPISGLETSASVLNRVHPGQFIYSRLFAFEAACGLVTDDYEGHFVSNEYPTFACGARVLPEFLFAYFKSGHVWQALSAGSKGLGVRRQRVQPERLLVHELLLPPMPLQEQIRAVFRKRPAFSAQHLEMKMQLDALMPATLDRAFNCAL